MRVRAVVVLASRILDSISERIVYADEAGCMCDHASSEAIAALSGVLEFAEKDPDSALALLHVIEHVLLRLPLDVPFGTFQPLFLEQAEQVGGGVVLRVAANG